MATETWYLNDRYSATDWGILGTTPGVYLLSWTTGFFYVGTRTVIALSVRDQNG